MPCREVSPIDKKVSFVTAVLAAEQMTKLCESFGVSRKTGYNVVGAVLGARACGGFTNFPARLIECRGRWRRRRRFWGRLSSGLRDLLSSSLHLCGDGQAGWQGQAHRTFELREHLIAVADRLNQNGSRPPSPT